MSLKTGLPGCAAGRFRLRSPERALVYLTDRTRVAYLPTRDDRSVPASSHEPERLLEASREEASR